MSLGDLFSRLRPVRAMRRVKRHLPAAARLGVERLEDREVPAASYSLDLGTATSPVESGYTPFAPNAYNPSVGYGWQSLSGISAFNRTTGTALTRDGHLGTDATFLVNLPDGNYQVTATLGDADFARDNVAIFAEGQK